MTSEHKPHTSHGQQSGHQGHFFNGLLVGLVLGVALSLLFTTKRGKQMVKALTAEGLDSMSELKRRLENIEFMLDEEDVVEDEYYEEPVEPVKKNGVKTERKIEVEEIDIDDEEPVKRGSKRRFFKGIRKN